MGTVILPRCVILTVVYASIQHRLPLPLPLCIRALNEQKISVLLNHTYPKPYSYTFHFPSGSFIIPLRNIHYPEIVNTEIFLKHNKPVTDNNVEMYVVYVVVDV